MEVKVDKEKHDKMVRQTLMQFNGQGVHPGEVVLALSEAVGRTIATIDGDMVQRELVDLAIKQMARAIDNGRGRILQ